MRALGPRPEFLHGLNHRVCRASPNCSGSLSHRAGKTGKAAYSQPLTTPPRRRASSARRNTPQTDSYAFARPLFDLLDGSLLGFILDENFHPWMVQRRNRPLPIGHLPKVIAALFDVMNRFLRALSGRFPFHLREHQEDSHQSPSQRRVHPNRLPNRNQFLRPVFEVRFIQLAEVLDRTTQPVELQHDQNIRRALQSPQRVGEPRPHVLPSRHHVLTQLHQLDSHHRAEETAKIWSPARAFVMSLVWVHAAAFRTTHRPTAESNTSVCL